MRYIKQYKIFESGENMRDIIHECFIPVEDLTTVHVETHLSAAYDHVIIKMLNLNEEVCEEIANAVSHCIGMGLYYYGASVFRKNHLSKIFTSNQVEEFYDFITDQKDELIDIIKIEFKRKKLKN